MLNNLNQKKAFTLIELIVVIAVIGILVLLAAPKFLGQTEKAKVTQIQNDVKAYEDAISAGLVKGEVDGVDKVDEWGWDEVSNETMEEYVDTNSLFDRKGTVSELNNDEFYLIDAKEVKVKSHLNGDFIYAKGGKVYYYEGGGLSGGGTGETEEPKDSDDHFEFVKYSSSPNSYIIDGEATKGYFHYTGEATEVEIPHEIMGNEVKDYYRMFFNNGSDGNGAAVTAVISDNLKITDMSQMFQNAEATELDLSSFDTSNVTSMSKMFRNSQVATLDLSLLDTSKVSDMNAMFSGSQATTLIGLDSFITSNVTNMSDMFMSSRATTLDLSSFDTSNVTDMSYMFWYSQADELDLSDWDTNNVTNMLQMFAGSQVTILDLSSFDTSNVTDMSYMFLGSQAISGYAKTQDDANRFNDPETNRPDGLEFEVEGSN